MKTLRGTIRRVVVPGVLTLALLPAGAVTASAAQAPAKRPAVHMDRVVVQSMVEPVNGKTNLPGNKGVQRVQRALRAKTKVKVKVDAHYGKKTRAAYKRWERRHTNPPGGRCGGPNGVPAAKTLTELGKGRFTVKGKVRIGKRVHYQGYKVNARTRKMLRAADAKLKSKIELTQGSYAGYSDASKCTHAGGGVVDVRGKVSTKKQRLRSLRTVRAMRNVGFAAWLRTPKQGFDPHIHAVAVGDTAAHTSTADQVADYRAKKDGLKGHGPDNTPKKFRSKFTWWERYKRSH